MIQPKAPRLHRRRFMMVGGAAAASTLLPFPVAASRAAGGPIRIHPDNPRYFLWRGKPRVLMGASEHFGALVNLDAELVTYLDTIARDRSNITRTFSGTLIEPYDGGDHLQVAGERFIAPWARSARPGFKKGGNKFDLSRFDPAYFARLRSFVREAGKRDSVVLYVLFTQHFDEGKWSVAPFHPGNNVNGISVDREGVYTMDRHGGMLPIQEAFVRKVVSELRPFDNVILEVTYNRAPELSSADWERHITNVLFEAQKKLGDKKLVAQNVGLKRDPGEITDPRIGVITHTLADQTLLRLYPDERRPIGMAETGFVPSTDREARFRAWDFALMGAGMFIHVDHTFAPRDQRGSRIIANPNAQFGAGPVQRRQLGVLIDVFNDLDFVKMKPSPELLLEPLPEPLTARLFAEPGRSYLIYVRPTPFPRELSIRWTGKLVATRSGAHTLHTKSNDGVRLRLDGKLIIDNWQERKPADDAAEVALQAGKAYALEVEYFYTGGEPVMRLEWEGPQLPRQLVPATSLQTPTGERGGLRAEHFLGRNFEKPHVVRKDAGIDHSAKTASVFAPPPWTPGPVTLGVDVAAGVYEIVWLDPASGGRHGHPKVVAHPGGALSLPHARLVDDIAVRVRLAKRA